MEQSYTCNIYIYIYIYIYIVVAVLGNYFCSLSM
jgi:hypothetical protein